MKHKIVIIALFIVIFSGIINAATFEDVPQDHWAYESVKILVDKGLLELYEDGTYRGTDKVSRYQLAEIIAKLLEDINSGTVNASTQDMDLLRKLSVEFQEELVDLAVRGDAFAEQINSLEKKNIIQDEFMAELKDVYIASLEEDIVNLNEEISNVESDVSQIIDSIIKIKQIEEKIAKIEETTNQQSNLIRENQKQIDELRELNIQTTDETIQELENKISVNNTRINSLEKDLNSVKSELVAKNEEIQTLEVENKNYRTYLYGAAGVSLILLLLSN
ncbi:MAG: S-layer homology domain-containing protein [Bacillota bacterium]